MHEAATRVAVVGHVEWVQFARVEEVPRAGEVVHASHPFEEPAGGGAVAAVQLARLAGKATLITALGDDETARRSRSRLSELGVEVHVATDELPSRRAVTLLDEHGERTIITLGERLDPPAELVRSVLEGGRRFDGIYFTAGGPDALRCAREFSKVLTASPRAVHGLGHGVELDALILSGRDEYEVSVAGGAEGEADTVVRTEGSEGGSYRQRGSEARHWGTIPPPGPVVDGYGCGDSFAAGVTFGLAAGMPIEEALAVGARCGAVCATGHGPYERQLRARDL
ncbi:MAG TPA: PfkB family carbohydrate kinase [Solirubrobacteraceae bacterium]|nr:PfkB family carbohydrate kinase [Solirubrobacteraceae bacterium]